jgi:hypothetical protein
MAAVSFSLSVTDSPMERAMWLMLIDLTSSKVREWIGPMPGCWRSWIEAYRAVSVNAGGRFRPCGKPPGFRIMAFSTDPERLAP